MEVIFIAFKVAPPETIGDLFEDSSSSPSKSEIYIDIFAVVIITCLVLVCAWWAYKVKHNRGQGSVNTVHHGHVVLKYAPLINEDDDVLNLKL